MHDFDNDAMFGCDLRVCPPKPNLMSEHTAMTNQQQHLITPPDELVGQWDEEGTSMFRPEYQTHLCAKAAQWGADQELDACINYFHEYDTSWGEDSDLIAGLRAARRPKAPSKAESALNALEHILRHSQTDHGANTIRLALERLKELEGAND